MLTMKRLIHLFVLLPLLSVVAACSSHSPDPGHEIVLVQKPALFGHGGVVDTPVKTGRTYTAITTSGVDVYMQPQKHDIDLPDTMTAKGVPVAFHAIMVLQITDSVHLISTFGENWYANNLEEPFKTIVRQAVKKRDMNDVAFNSAVSDEIDAEVRDGVAKFIAEKRLPVRLITMTLGRANPPDAVKSQRIETAAQEQRIQTEQQKRLAEDQRLKAEQARANADNAYREAMHLSPEQFIQLKTIEMQETVCGPNGSKTCTFIQNGTPSVYNLNR